VTVRRAERNCCDGLCTRGQPCPAFAPGVIEGPHRAGLLARLLRALAALRRALW